MTRNPKPSSLFVSGILITAAVAAMVTVRPHAQVLQGQLLRPPIQIELGEANMTVTIPQGSPPVQVGPNAAGTTVTFPDGAVQLLGPGDSITIEFPKGGSVTVPTGKKRPITVTGASASQNIIRKHIGQPKYEDPT